MDFMKVFDQTVREIRREVNLKVLKVPEIEQKVLDATSNEPWGPHGSALSEIARATNKFSECPMIMNVLWTRLTDTGANWRHVYKALAVIEYLISNGSERALDDILEHSFQISSISGFEYVEPSGKDVGNNVRKKVETILALLDDTEKIKAVRDKAAANRDKFVGLSSTGISYKSKLNSYGSNDYHHSDRYGGIGGQREGDSFRDSYENTEGYHQENKDDQVRSRDSIDSKNEGNKLKKGVGSKAKDQDALPAKPMAKPGYPSDKRSSTQPNSIEDDFDDFDPRGSATTGSVEANSSQMDLLGQGLLIDLMDAPASLPAETTLDNTTAPENDLFADNATAAENDLFADAVFVSASSHVEAVGDSHSQGSIEFFTNQPAFPSKYTSNVDLLAGPDPSLPPETKSSKLEPANSNNLDPFAAVPLANFEGPDFSGAFTSHTDSVVTEPSKKSIDSNLKNVDQSSVATKSPSKKDTFQVKSGIWADSLSRGLIDLNISAPKKISLADVGVVGGLGDGSDEKRPASTYMGSSMGARSVWGTSGFPTTETINGFTASGKQQFGSFN